MNRSWSNKHDDKRIRGRRLMARNKRILSINPLCAECQKHGKVTVATEVDHIIPLFKGGTEEDNNLQGLCRACHEVKTLADTGKKPYTQACDKTGLPTDSNHPWNKEK